MPLNFITTLFFTLILATLFLSTGTAEICRSPNQDDFEQAQVLLEASHKGCCDGNAQLCRSEKAALTLLSGALEEHTSAAPTAAGSEKGCGKQTSEVNAAGWMGQGWGDGESSEAVCSSRRQQVAVAAHPHMLPLTDQEVAHTCELPSSDKEGAPSSAGARRTWAVLARRSLLAALFAFSLALLFTVRHIDDAPSWLMHCISWALSVPVMQLQRERPSRVLKYLMDVYVFSRSYSKMLLLSILTGTLIAYGGIALYAVASEEEWEGQGLGTGRDASEDGKTSLSEAMWAAAAGAGFNWAFFPSSSNAVRCVSTLIAVCGSFITAALLTLVSDALGERVDELKSGRGAVLETGHLLILGWSERVFSLLEQLALGCELSGGSTVVILSEQNKDKCTEEIWRRGIDMKKNRLVIREGSIHSVPELQKVCAPLARSILILTDPQDFSSDARTLRCLLCLQSANPAVSEGALTAGVLAEMCHADQADLLMQLAGEDRVRTVCSPGLMGRLMVQCTRYPRLIEVLQEIVGFQGSETYISTNTQPLVGLPFGFLQSAFEHAVPLGLRKAQSDVPLVINPPYGELVEEGAAALRLAVVASPITKLRTKRHACSRRLSSHSQSIGG
ncbi:hypothetical protein DUNSADRAFT_18299 [Dunaliella salina]|uniref:CASTOR/POLLUX/SYM8 ion channel conserved domain-containing protein n=1 Tax=Dunaliella salina TaxID=3046 RepID=A0ABQ7G0A4_DUNSA|nr:hypothetical protein DUNSADRAFT_18299 [Dunaliella salina]|eukprot:KAF5828037.1 hypothetical protein DUNSADRAFT_18299 [Dunaliella salina]